MTGPDWSVLERDPHIRVGQAVPRHPLQQAGRLTLGPPGIESHVVPYFTGHRSEPGSQPHLGDLGILAPYGFATYDRPFWNRTVFDIADT
ncbi:hypothetical protein GCM10022223_20260 [Kineosporia mesophila]|uniref:Uncharacterized protein n=1 Tax=Kineosporia mesophila TaxID=566012 RepID=A0ABP6ZBL0_9ACTN